VWSAQCSRRSIAAEAVTFEAPKVTKSAAQQKGFFAARAFALQIRQNLGCNLFAGEPVAFRPLCKKLLCPAAHVACIVLPDFGRSCSAERKRIKSHFISSDSEKPIHEYSALHGQVYLADIRKSCN
jgi:hypothetical protein